MSGRRDRPLDDAERHPSLDAAGLARLSGVLEHPAAPRWNHTCGERLDAAGLAAVQAFARDVREHPPEWEPGVEPAWVAPFVARCLATVPAYRRRGAGRPRGLAELPTTGRADLLAEPWSFVPDDLPLDDLVVHSTSGTRGRPLPVLQTPTVVASYYPLVQAALAVHDVPWPAHPPAGLSGRPVAWMTVAYQADTYVLASRSAYLAGGGAAEAGGAAAGIGTAKVNLHEGAWRDEADRARFVAYCDPAVVAGDPLALEVLAGLGAELHVKAAVSTSSAIGPGRETVLRRKLGCPVIDVYSAAEIGPVAYALPRGGAYALVQPWLFVEVLDRTGGPCAPGVQGEVTVTGGMNPLLPLLRYRTGDRAALGWRGRRPELTMLEGRRCVPLVTSTGRRVNSVDVTKALAALAVEHWSVHQHAPGALTVRVAAGDAGRDRARAVADAVAGVLGEGAAVSVDVLADGDDLPPFTSDLAVE